MKINPAVKVGILTVISLIVLTLSILWIKGRAISVGERLEVAFKDVDGMRAGSAVQMMGIRIGQVEEVFPVINNEKSFVKIRFVITEPNIEIPKASEISIQQSGIIGEKFLEISPPRMRTTFIVFDSVEKKIIHAKDAVKVFVSGEYINAGVVKTVEVVNTKTLSFSKRAELKAPYVYKIGYIITVPGLLVPENVSAKIETKKDSRILKLDPPSDFIVELPELDSDYTIVEPLRLKDFLDLQLRAAHSLNETNERINTMMTGETISDLKETLKNIKDITLKANETVDQATLLVKSSRNELDSAMNMAGKLTDRIIILTDNLNNIMADPEFKDTFIATTKSVNETTKNLSEILADPKTRQTIEYINTTTKNLSEISGYVNDLSQDKEFKAEFGNTIKNLNASMSELSTSLKSVSDVTATEEKTIKQIIDDTSDISENLKKFSEKLNKRFLLMRLMF